MVTIPKLSYYSRRRTYPSDPSTSGSDPYKMETIQVLRGEIAVLKGNKPNPKIKFGGKGERRKEMQKRSLQKGIAMIQANFIIKKTPSFEQ